MRSHRKNQLIKPKSVHCVQSTPSDGCFSGDFERDLQALQDILSDESDLKTNLIRTRDNHRIALLFYPELVNKGILTRSVIKPLQMMEAMPTVERVTEQVISVPETGSTRDLREAANTLFDGSVLLVIENVPLGVWAHIIQVEHRPIERSQSEDNIIGPHQNFSESLAQNVAMMHRILATPHLKIRSLEVGKLSRTKVAVMYVDGVAQPELVAEAMRRLERIDIDFITGAAYLRDFVEDQPTFLMPQVRVTERPIRVAAALVEGRIAIMAESDPTALIAPTFLPDFVQTSEDYNDKTLVAVFYRWLRILSGGLAVFLPGFWISLVSFHHAIIPAPLFQSIVAGREQVPMPTVLEMFLLLLAFDVVLEASTRLPSAVGQAIGIVGAIILGQSAVQASLISPTATIVVALAGLANFTQPSPTLLAPIRVAKYAVLAACSVFGLYGAVWAALFGIIRFTSLRSFGYPYMYPTGPFDPKGIQDIIIRRPIYNQQHRPHLLAPKNERRMAPGLKPRPKKEQPNED